LAFVSKKYADALHYGIRIFYVIFDVGNGSAFPTVREIRALAASISWSYILSVVLT
jgi:hypothetical protein